MNRTHTTKRSRRFGFPSALLNGLAVLLALANILPGAIEPAFVTVGDTDNPADIAGQGHVGYPYRIGVYEVTRAEYAAFLNAVATTDTHALYAPGMQIVRNGQSGYYSYAAVDGRKPVAYVSWYSALRFANWLHNGQPTGLQAAATTEDGAYTFNGDTEVGPRNASARFFLPSEDEWHKAAYYRGGTTGTYWTYPTRSDALPVAVAPPGSDNAANFDDIVGNVTDVGSYTASFGPYGSFDQAGNLWEWTQGVVDGDRALRGGDFNAYDLLLRASYRDAETATAQSPFIGFRVAALFNDDPLPTFLLTVNRGSGSGAYTAGTIVEIAADPAPTSRIFDRWTGDVSTVSDPSAAITSVRVPDANVTLTAQYKDLPNQTFILTVQNGVGDGPYTAGTVVDITADPAPGGQLFARWTGADGAIADPLAQATTVTMPASELTVTATYRVYAPRTVTLLNPSGTIDTDTPTFEWTDEPEATWYQLWVNREGKKHAVVWIQGEPQAVLARALPFGNYTWSVQPWSPVYGFGPWADPVAFTYGIPVPLAPMNGTVPQRAPELSWSPVTGATWYQIWITRNGEKYISRWVNNTSAWRVPFDLPFGKYSWWVRAHHPLHGSSPWSPPAEFLLGVPTALTPSGALSTVPTRLQWDDASCRDADWYRVWISRGQETYWSGWVSKQDTTPLPGELREMTIPVSVRSGTYTWCVRAWDPLGTGPWSDGKGFSWNSGDSHRDD